MWVDSMAHLLIPIFRMILANLWFFPDINCALCLSSLYKFLIHWLLMFILTLPLLPSFHLIIIGFDLLIYFITALLPWVIISIKGNQLHWLVLEHQSLVWTQISQLRSLLWECLLDIIIFIDPNTWGCIYWIRCTLYLKIRWDGTYSHIQTFDVI